MSKFDQIEAADDVDEGTYARFSPPMNGEEYALLDDPKAFAHYQECRHRRQYGVPSDVLLTMTTARTKSVYEIYPELAPQ